MRRALALAFSLAPSLAFGDAHDEAVALFDQGMRDMKGGDYAKACKEFAASLERWADSGTKGSLAICYTSLGRVATAWQLWHELADTAPTPQLRADATKKAAKLESRLPHYVAKLKGPTPGLVVTVNGSKIDPTVGLALPVDPGKLVVTGDAPGYESWSQELTASEGQTTNIEVPVLARAKAKDAKGSAPPLDGGAAKATFVGEIKPGATADGSLARDGQLDGYVLNVRAGARVKIEVTHGGSKLALDTLVYVYGPSGAAGYSATAIYSDDDGGSGKLSKIASATLADAGKYAVVIAAKNKTRGSYRLVVTCLSGQCEPEVGVSIDHGKVGTGGRGDIVAPPAGADDTARTRRRRHLIGLGVGVVGAGGLVAGGLFGLQASGKYDDAKKTCGGSITSCDPSKLATAQQQVKDARSAANLSTIFFAAGGAAAVVGVVVYLTAPKVVEDNRVKVTPVVGAGTLGIALSGSL